MPGCLFIEWPPSASCLLIKQYVSNFEGASVAWKLCGFVALDSCASTLGARGGFKQDASSYRRIAHQMEVRVMIQYYTISHFCSLPRNALMGPQAF